MSGNLTKKEGKMNKQLIEAEKGISDNKMLTSKLKCRLTFLELIKMAEARRDAIIDRPYNKIFGTKHELEDELNFLTKMIARLQNRYDTLTKEICQPTPPKLTGNL